MIRFLKLIFSLLSVVLTTWVSVNASAAAIPDDYWEKGRRLSDFTLFDAYQVKSTDPAKQKEYGTLLFLYRDLHTCRGNDICRRLAMAWLTRDGRVIELQIPEHAFFSNWLKRNDQGVGFGNGNQFFLPTPAALNFSGPTIITSAGAQGENLILHFQLSGHPYTNQIFERIVTTAQDKSSLAQIRQQLKQASYFPPFEDATKESRYMVYFKAKDNSAGYIISAPGLMGYLSEWQLIEFKLDATGVQSFFSAPSRYTASELDHIQFGADPGFKLKIANHEKFLKTAQLSFVAGIGQILTPKQNELIVNNDKFVLGGDDETQDVLNQFTLSYSGTKQTEVPVDPFYEMLAKSHLCNSILSPAPGGIPATNSGSLHGTGNSGPPFNANAIPIGSSIGYLRRMGISIHP